MFKFDRKIVFLFLGRIVQALLSILTVRLMTELLEPKEVGHQYLINSMILWFSLVLINPVGMYVNRHLHEWQAKKKVYPYIYNLNRYFFIIAVLSLPTIFLAKKVFGVGAFLPDMELVIFLGFYVYFSTWFQTLVSFFNLLEFQKIFVSLNIFSQFLGLVFAVAGVKLLQPGALVWLAGLLLGQIVTLAVAFILFTKKMPKEQFSEQPDAETLFQEKIFQFCYPIAITTFFMWFTSQGYRLMVERYLGTEALASIGVGLGLAASLAGIVESITTQYFYPQYYAALPGSDLAKRALAWKSLWMKTTIVYVPFCFLTWSVCYLVVRVLTAPSFHHVTSFVLYGAVIELFRQLSNITYLVSHGEKKTQNTIWPYLFGAGFLFLALETLRFAGLLEIRSILVSLVLAGLGIYIYNLVVVARLISVRIDFGLIAKTFLFAWPLLGPVFFLSVDSSIGLLFGFGGLSGLWCLASVYILLRKRLSSV